MIDEQTTLEQRSGSKWARLPFRRAVGLYLAIRVATLLSVGVVNLFTHRGVLRNLSVWDGAWFLKAVHDGWPVHLPVAHGHVLANPIAFFPLLPLIMRALSALTGLSPASVGLVVSGLSGLGAVVAVGVVARTFATDDQAERAALLFAVSPGAFVFSLIYAEGLLITLAALSLWSLLHRKWLLAGVLAALASAASPVGLALVVSCAVAAFDDVRRYHRWRSLGALVLAPLGFVAWMTYLWRHTGNLMAWRLTEREGWHSYPSLGYPLHIVATFLANPLAPTMTGQILFAGTVLSLAALVISFRERQPAVVWAFSAAVLVLAMISAPVGLRPRFVMLAFPLVIGLATRWSGWRYWCLVALSGLGLVLMTIESLNSFAVFP